MNEDIQDTHPGPKRGQILFASILALFSAILSAFLWDQTVWKEGKDLFSQARFWPAVGVFGMLLFTSLHIWKLPRRKLVAADWTEGRKWLEVIEFAIWFLGYVWFVPIAGYLPVTILFALALTWRMGYRSPRMLWIAALLGIVVVVVFKGVLQVRIPGAAAYEYLPGAVRNFFILYL